MNVKLFVVQGRPRGKTLLFPFGEFLIGRGAECHIRPNSDWVSRQHCLLRVTPDGVFIRDLGSRNGTLVNGIRVVDERRLGNSDQLQVGPLVFEVQVETYPSPSSPLGPTVSDQGETGLTCSDTAELPRFIEPSPGDALEQDEEPPTLYTSLPPSS
jgi:pSer/pThr/pTyr-binding forkhead associated (FHA) protein